MKKKLFIFTIVLSLLITFAPNTVNATNNKVLNQKRVTERQKFKITKPTQAQIKAVGSELEYYKQIALEDVDSMYFASSEREYSDEIRAIIDSYYNYLCDKINSIENQSDLIDQLFYFFGMYIPVYSDEMFQDLYTLDTLVLFDNNKVMGATVDEFKDNMLEIIDQEFGCYTNIKDQYNDYYSSIVQGDKTTVENLVSAATDWESLANALGISRMIASNYDELYSFAESLESSYYCSYEDDYDDDDDDDYYDEDDYEIIERLGINTAPEIYIGQVIYTKEEINKIKEGLTLYIQNYYDRQLEEANYPVDNTVTSLVNNAVDEISKATNVDEMVSLYERTIEKLVKTTGVEYKDYSYARSRRFTKKMQALKKTYASYDLYYDTDAYHNEYVIDMAISLIDYYEITKDVEVPSDIISRLTEILDETPTYSQRLKLVKKESVTELNKYKNNKKYDQSKVVTIVNQGIKLINSSTDIDDVYNLVYNYSQKAEATIYKFKITTSKVGKGTITKSGSVKYGRSYTVKIKPTVGYKISAIYVDGKKVKLTEKYTFKNVTKKHTIKVIFK